MIKNDYDDFFSIVIRPCIDKIIVETEQYGCHYVGGKCQNSIYHHYQNKRDFIKDRYMKKAEDAALDRHKVAVCMMYAILKTKPIKVNRFIPDLPEKALLANEYLAFFVSLNILEMYRKDQLGENADCEIILPRTYHEDSENKSDFLSNTCKALYYIGLQGIEKLDVFAYSSILFLLEKYTDSFILTR